MGRVARVLVYRVFQRCGTFEVVLTGVDYDGKYTDKQTMIPCTKRLVESLEAARVSFNPESRKKPAGWLARWSSVEDDGKAQSDLICV